MVNLTQAYMAATQSVHGTENHSMAPRITAWRESQHGEDHSMANAKGVRASTLNS